MQLESSKIETIQRYFKTCPVIKAYLFGSYVKNTVTKTSDIDILVELDYSKNVGLEFIQMQMDLEKLLSQKVDLVSARGLSKYIQPTIELEKELIYAR